MKFKVGLLLCLGLGFMGGQFMVKPQPFWKPMSEVSSPGKVLDSRLQTLVIVGDERISSATIDFEVQFTKLGVFDDLAPLTPEQVVKVDHGLKEQVLTQLIERKLLIQMIERDKYFDRSAPELYTKCTETAAAVIKSNESIESNPLFQNLLRERLCEDSLIETYVAGRLTQNLSVSTEEVQKEVEKLKSSAVLEPRVTLKQILLATEDEAKKVKLSLNASNFSTVAKERSIAPEGKNGGLIANLRRSDLAPIFDVAFSMQPGQISDIIKTPYGFHILQLIKKAKSAGFDDSESEARITQDLLNGKRAEERKKWVLLALRTYDVRWASSGSAF